MKIKEQPTYATFIDYFQVFCKDDYNVIINSDIVLDYDTTDLCRTVPEGTVYALARYEVDYKTYKEPIETWNSTLHYFPHYSQDTWIFYRSNLDTTQLNIYLGAQACDNLIAYFIESQNLKVTNPCLSIKTYHIHSSTIRNYNRKYNYKSNSLFISPSRLEDYKSTVYTKHFNENPKYYTYNSNTINDVLNVRYNSPKNNSMIDYMYRRPKYNDLAVGLVFFNSARSKRLLMNYLYIVEKLKIAKIPYYTLELVYDGRSPEITDAFHLRGSSYMFQKENLCHLLEKRIPKYYTKLLFLDADLVFSDPDWYNNLSESLNTYEVVQPFTNALWLNLEYNNIIMQRITCVLDKDKAECNIQGAHVGFAWAFQRSYFNEVGMFRYDITGGGDSYCSMLYLNNRSYLKKDSAVKQCTNEFNNMFNNSRRPSLNFLNGNIYHLWHGSIENRNYMCRRSLLNTDNDITDILTETSDGILKFIDININNKFYNFFMNRYDDGLSSPTNIQVFELKPEVKPEVKPALTPEVKPEVKAEVPILSTRIRSTRGE
jgi:hypothetical protein